MWPLTTFTIGFRGLMVIHRVETVYPNYFEIGVLNDPAHSLRINTIKNGMLAETKFLDRPAEGAPRTWAIRVDNPIGHGVSTYTHGPSNFVRKQHTDEKDFRWITELNEVFPQIEDELITNAFSPLLKICNGIFSTRVKSPELAMMVNGASQPFGCIAAVVACDIPMLPGRVRLVDEADPLGSLFDFEPDENTIYEFANTPGDAHAEPKDTMHGSENEDSDDDDDDDEDPCQFDHFKSYYQLFPPSKDRPMICFRKEGKRPAPDPATCGAVGAGGIKVPFGGGGT